MVRILTHFNKIFKITFVTVKLLKKTLKRTMFSTNKRKAVTRRVKEIQPTLFSAKQEKFKRTTDFSLLDRLDSIIL